MAYFEVTHREQIQSLLPLLISFQISLATLYGFKLPPRLKEKHYWESAYSSWVKQLGNCIDTLTFYHDLSLHQPYGIWCHSIAIASNRFRTVKARPSIRTCCLHRSWNQTERKYQDVWCLNCRYYWSAEETRELTLSKTPTLAATQKSGQCQCFCIFLQGRANAYLRISHT